MTKAATRCRISSSPSAIRSSVLSQRIRSKKLNRLVISLLALAIGALPVLAHAADVKVGYVNIEKVLEAAPQAESARTAIEKEFAPRDRELVRFQKDLRDMAERLEKDGAIMSESERTDLAQEIRAKKRDLKR